MKVGVMVALACVTVFRGAFAEDYDIYKPVYKVPSRLKALLPTGTPAKPLFSPHIIGGTEAEPHSHPHQVALMVDVFQKDGKGPKVAGFCGGSLLSDSWVITAAHCVDKDMLLDDVPQDSLHLYGVNVTVIAGVHDFTNKKESGIQVAQVPDANVLKHPEWEVFSYSLSNDIALLRLQNPLLLDKQVKAIRLPKSSQRSESFYNYDVTMTGWGDIGNQKLSQVLNTLDSKVLGNFYCKARYLFLSVTDTNICASSSGWTGVCRGDSGGPMTIMEADHERTLIGLNSFSIGCSWKFPMVHTRVTSYLDWILGITGIPERK